jgi:hypothetical protein
MTKQTLQLTLAMMMAVSGSGLAMAQAPLSGNPTPLSKPGGYASTELAEIYRQSIGTGYSGQSLNSIALHSARVNNPNFGNPNYGRPTSGGGPRIGLGVGGSQANKPFSAYSPTPTVSPYLNLFREDIEGGGDLNYNTLVRPMLQQQQFNQQVQRQNIDISRRLQSMAAQSDFNPEGSRQQYPTGHQTVYRYYGRFYPTMNARVRR